MTSMGFEFRADLPQGLAKVTSPADKPLRSRVGEGIASEDDRTVLAPRRCCRMDYAGSRSGRGGYGRPCWRVYWLGYWVSIECASRLLRRPKSPATMPKSSGDRFIRESRNGLARRSPARLQNDSVSTPAGGQLATSLHLKEYSPETVLTICIRAISKMLLWKVCPRDFLFSSH